MPYVWSGILFWVFFSFYNISLIFPFHFPQSLHPPQTAPKTFKSSSDYVSDLFNIQIAPRPMKKDASTATPEVSPQKRWDKSLFGHETSTNNCIFPPVFSPLDILTTSSTYFQVSEPKAKLMTRYSREMTLINGDCCDLTKKKVSFWSNFVFTVLNNWKFTKSS